MKRFSIFFPVLCLLLTLGLTSCRKTARMHVEHPDWAPDVQKNINGFLDRYQDKTNAYVVFDFDNTCSIFDVEMQTVVYQVENMCFAMTPEEFQANLAIENNGTPDCDTLQMALQDIQVSYEKLYEKYGPFTPEGVSNEQKLQLSKDPWWKEFASKMLWTYDEVCGRMGIDVGYCWLLYWFSGMTEEQVYALSTTSFEKYASVPTFNRLIIGDPNLPTNLGSKRYKATHGVSVSENIRELWQALQADGIDVWVCSASATPVIVAAVDFFGLHPYCKGVLGMTVARNDSTSCYIPSYDYETGYALLAQEDGTWIPDTLRLPLAAQPVRVGKTESICHTLLPRYGGQGPLAGFMDSSGDYDFCTNFQSMRMVVCFNRANRKVTDGGGLIAALAIHQRDNLGLNIRKAGRKGETLYLLQGRDENNQRTLRPSNTTLRFGENEEQLFRGPENEQLLQYFKDNQLSTGEILNTFCIKTNLKDSPLGFPYGWHTSYKGYHSIPAVE